MLEGGLTGAGAGRRRAHAGPGSLDLTLEAAASALGQHPAWCWGECGQLWEGGKGTRSVCCSPQLPRPPPRVGAHLTARAPPGPAGQWSGAAVQQPGQRAPAAVAPPADAGPGGGTGAGLGGGRDAQLSPRIETIPGGEWALTRALPQSPLAIDCLGPSEPHFTRLYNGKVSPALARMRPPMGTGGLHEPSTGCSQEECRRESLPWVPIPQAPQESCLDLLVDQPHSLLSILDAQTWLSQVSPSCWETRSGGCLVARPEPAGPSRGEIKSEVLGPCPQALSTTWEGGGHTGFRSLVSG